MESEKRAVPIFSLSDYHKDGVVTPIFSKGDKAKEVAERWSKKHKETFVASPVHGLWDRLLEFAKIGFVGVLFDDLHPVYFLNSLSEFDLIRPSIAQLDVHLDGKIDDGKSRIYKLYFGIRGLRAIDEREVSPWLDLSAADRLSASCLFCDHPLPERVDQFWDINLPNNETPRFSHEGTLLGSYVFQDGIRSIFTNKIKAEKQREKMADGEETHVRKITIKLPDYLTELWTNCSLHDIILNPGSPRYLQGYFIRRKDVWYLRTLRGVFALTEDGFTLAPTEAPLHDEVEGHFPKMLELPGVPSVTQYPLYHILGVNTSSVSRREAMEIIGEEFAKEPPDKFKPAVCGPDAYAIDMMDKKVQLSLDEELMPNDWYGPVLFDNIIAASHWLTQVLLPYEFEARVEGYETMRGFSSASGNENVEGPRVVYVYNAIKQLMVNVLTEGYRPEHSVHLQRLICKFSETLHIHNVGYLADFAFYGGLIDSQNDEILEDISLFRQKFSRLQERVRTKSHFTETQLKELRRMIGSVVDELSEESKVILHTAVNEYQSLGKRPAHDYAGVSIKLCKVVEREMLLRIFKPWRKQLREKLKKQGIRELKEVTRLDDTQLTAFNFLEDNQKGKLTLGTMGFLLASLESVTDNGALRTLREYMDGFQDSTWLTSDDCFQAVRKISSKYRNGGAHYKLVNYELCQEAFTFIVSSETAFLSRIIGATKRVSGIGDGAA